MDGRSPIEHLGLRQAVGYGFLIHLRALVDFLYCRQGQDDDILVTDFRKLPGFRFPANARPDWVSEVKKKLNKRLAHITSPRWKEPNPEMNFYHKRVPEILHVLSLFRDALPSEFRKLLSTEVDRYASRDAALWIVRH